MQGSSYNDLWERSGVLVNKVIEGIYPKHVLPNESNDYTDSNERQDTNRYSFFCRTRYFLHLVTIGDES